MLHSYRRAFSTGLACLLVVLLILVLTGDMGGRESALLLARVTHVFAAMVWVGLIWFVNVVQLGALAKADDAARAVIMTAIVPRVADEFRRAANITVISGIVLLASLGYLSGRPLGANVWIWAGTAGGLAMVAFVHAKIWPALQLLLDPVITDKQAKAEARETVRFYARVNLLLALPVTFAMLAAAHG